MMKVIIVWFEMVLRCAYDFEVIGSVVADQGLSRGWQNGLRW